MITVTNTTDRGAGSLRDAIAKATPGTTIRFAPSLANKTIALSRAIDITKSVTIDGTGVAGLTLSGNHVTRILSVAQQNVSVAVRNLTFADAYLPKDLGGAIHTVQHVNLTAENCQFRGNVSRGGAAIFMRDFGNLTVINSQFDKNDGATYGNLEVSGGAIGTLSKCNVLLKGSKFTNNKGINGGGIYSIFSNVTVQDSTFSNNDTTAGQFLPGGTRGFGGAIYVDGASIPHDGRFYRDLAHGDKVGGTIRITNTRIDGNRAAEQGGGLFLFGYPQDKVIVENSTIVNNTVITHSGVAIGGGLRSGPTQLTINSTTFANNKAQTKGGGLYYDGETPVNITNSTFSANQVQGTSGQGGAIYSRQWNSATSITNSTFAYNAASGEAGAIFDERQPITVKNSIFYYNTAANAQKLKQQTNKQLVEGSGNIEFPASSAKDFKVTSNVQLVDPRLGPLQDNGGGVLTHALLPGSAAINKGVKTGAPTVDERGFIRDGLVDIGALEAGAKAKSLAAARSLGRDTLLGTAKHALLSGMDNDLLVGLHQGAATHFVYAGASQKDALAGSLVAAPDRLKNFNVAEGDRLQLDSDENLNTSELPAGLFNAGLQLGGSLRAAVQSGYADKNQQRSGDQKLKADQAVFLEWQDHTYLVVNDQAQRFSAARDLVVDVTGIQMSGSDATAGVLAIARYFA